MNLIVFKKYIKAMRPLTLTAIIAPILGAYFLACETINISYLRYNNFVYCIIVGIGIQIATNIFNDLIDEKTGVDRNRIGDARFSHELSKKSLLGIALLLLAIAFVAIIALAYQFLIFLPIGLLSLYLSYGYTGGIYPLAYNGLGEVFVYLFFGIVAFLGTFYSLTQNIGTYAVISSSYFGLLSVLIIYANNFRDLANDKIYNKNTIAVIFEAQSKNIFIVFLILIIPHVLVLSYLKNTLFLSFSLLPIFAIFLAITMELPRQKIFKLCIVNLVICSLFYNLNMSINN